VVLFALDLVAVLSCVKKYATLSSSWPSSFSHV
jgi:hypothetical protein